jgi:hypothetical protein
MAAKIECALSDTVFFPISKVCARGVTLQKKMEKGSKSEDCLDKHCVGLRIIWMRVMAV